MLEEFGLLRYLQEKLGDTAGRLQFDVIQHGAAARKAEEAAELKSMEMAELKSIEMAELKSKLQLEFEGELKRQREKKTEKTEKLMQSAMAAANEIDPLTGQMKGMSTADYAKALNNSLGGQALEGQKMCHIIANANGGADHPDNYLTLGSKFNKCIGARYDYLNCLLAGQAQTERAVLVSKKMGNKPRSAKQEKKYYEFQSSSQSDATVEAEYLIERGHKFWTALKYLDSHVS